MTYLYQRDRDEAVKIPDGEILVIPDHAIGALRGYWKVEWEGPLIKWAISDMIVLGKVFIDAGAHVGTWTLPFAKAGHFVHAFEPTSEFAQCLRTATELNGCADNVEVHQIALGNEDGSADLRITAVCGGCNSIAGPPTSLQPAHINPVYGIEKVQVLKLDSITDLHSMDMLSNIGLIKLDVEGNELDVILGAVKTLEHNGWPPIIYECLLAPWYTEKRVELEAFLVELGYKVVRIRGGNYPPMFLASDHSNHR